MEFRIFSPLIGKKFSERSHIFFYNFFFQKIPPKNFLTNNPNFAKKIYIIVYRGRMQYMFLQNSAHFSTMQIFPLRLWNIFCGFFLAEFFFHKIFVPIFFYPNFPNKIYNFPKFRCGLGPMLHAIFRLHAFVYFLPYI